MSDFDAVIIGAGVIGLAVARELAQRGAAVLVIEAADGIGTGTSSRNSEIIHAGLYYEIGSLKARLCQEGRLALYAYCAERGIPYRRCGKLLVATDAAELAAVARLAERGRANGAGDLAMLSGDEVRAMEPAVSAVGGLWSPSTGIIDSHAFMLSLQGDAENVGASFAFRTPFSGAEIGAEEFVVSCGGADPFQITSTALVNAAGLHASSVAKHVKGLAPVYIPETLFCKGNYFTLAGPVPFSRLIYPAPHDHGLGVHLTLDMAGQARFGPDTEWIHDLDYSVSENLRPAFEEAIRRYWPGLPDGMLVPGYAGIRPKIVGRGQPAADFRIDGPEQHGIAGLINLFGIESPGLTASLALAREVADRI